MTDQNDMQVRDPENNGASDGQFGDVISVLDVLLIFAKRKNFLLGFPMGVAVVTALIMFMLPNVYTGTALLLPPPQAASPFGAALATIAGADASSAGLTSSASTYVGILNGRTVADKLIEMFDLKVVYGVDTFGDARKALASATKIEVTTEGLISVNVDDTVPMRSAALANAYVDILDRLTQDIAITEAGQRREFLEKQLRTVRDKLTDAEIAMKRMQEKTGVLSLDEQARVIIENIAALRAQIAGREVQLESMKTFATPRHPEMVRLQQEIASLRGQLKALEGGEVAGEGNIFVPTGKVPEAGMEYLRRMRDLKYYEMLFQIVAKQYELARVDQVRDTSRVQIVDRAVVPDVKSKPMRLLITVIVGLVAGFVALLWVIVAEGFERASKDPQQAWRVERLRRYLAFRRTEG